MKTSARACRTKGLTFPEAVALAAVILLSLAVAWGMVVQGTGCKARGGRINCVSNLKQIGLAMRMWANDHGDKFPWQVSMSETGTLELVEAGSLTYYHFLAVSNELTSPKPLTCNDDRKKSRVSDWAKLDDSHLSYFVSLEASQANPQSILSGDRNILGGQAGTNRIVRFNAQSKPGWGADLHKRAGNIGLADGSAHQVTDSSLQKQLQAAFQSMPSTAELRFLIPKPN